MEPEILLCGIVSGQCCTDQWSQLFRHTTSASTAEFQTLNHILHLGYFEKKLPAAAMHLVRPAYIMLQCDTRTLHCQQTETDTQWQVVTNPE
jgi:hypothetical protein